MLDPKKIEAIMNSLTETLPTGMSALHSDIEKNFRTALSAALSRLDLVTREEFDVQVQLLKRTREKLTLLEQRVAELEKRQQG